MFDIIFDAFTTFNALGFLIGAVYLLAISALFISLLCLCYGLKLFAGIVACARRL